MGGLNERKKEWLAEGKVRLDGNSIRREMKKRGSRRGIRGLCPE